MARLTVLISGSGTNLQALIDATTASSSLLPNAQIVRVISNRKNAYGLQRAENASIPTSVFNLISNGYTKRFPNSEAGSKAATSAAREAFDADLASMILHDKPDIVIMAGWMHIVSSHFLTPLSQANVKLINLHPALPGEYNGTDAIDRAWADWQAGKISRTGCMIHRVIAEVDMGAPIVMREIPFQQNEEKESFEQRFHNIEHEIIVEGTRKIVEEIKTAP
ncbi:MAG: hypothetical protein Q9162_000704 [Coniocarpon cinnabarinum]